MDDGGTERHLSITVSTLATRDELRHHSFSRGDEKQR
jgi:hypothetical protein